MKSAFLIAATAAVCASSADAFGSSFGGQQLQNGASNAGRSMSMEYIPSGMSKEQWQKIKNKERNANKGKDLGRTGITSFKSRSFADWQKSGGVNLFPVDPNSVKDESELPYMQRKGGSADGEDLKPKKGGFGGFFNFGKKEPEPEPEPEPKKPNIWTGF